MNVNKRKPKVKAKARVTRKVRSKAKTAKPVVKGKKKAPPKKVVKKVAKKASVPKKKRPPKLSNLLIAGVPIPKKNPPKRGRKRSVLVNGGASETLAFLRYEAGLIYVTDLEGATLQDIKNLPRFSGISTDTLGHWCAQDGWVEKRREFGATILTKTASKIATQLVRVRVESLDKNKKILDMMYDRIMTKDEGKELEARGLESMVNAYNTMHRSMDEQRERLADTIMPETLIVDAALDDKPRASPVAPRLSQEEKREAALAIIRVRREHQRSGIKAIAREKEEANTTEEKPPVQLVTGNK